MNASKDLLSVLTGAVIDRFTDEGFLLKKDRYFEKVSETGRVYRYTLKLSKTKSWFSLHLTLHLLDKSLMTEVNKVLEKALRDKTLKYPESFSCAMIEDVIKARTSNNVVAELTDWRALKKPDEKLEKFNARFSIWLYSFDTLEEKFDWKEQLLESVRLAHAWFEKVDSPDWIEENSGYPSLYLLSKQPALEKLTARYAYLLKKATNPRELELFYRHLS